MKISQSNLVIYFRSCIGYESTFKAHQIPRGRYHYHWKLQPWKQTTQTALDSRENMRLRASPDGQYLMQSESFIWLHISAWFHSRAELSGNETAKQTAGCKTAESMTLYNLQSFIFIPHIREKSKTCIRYPQTGIQTFDESHSGWRDWDTFSHQQRELLGKSTKLVQQGKGSATCYSIAPEYSDTDSKESKSN